MSRRGKVLWYGVAIAMLIISTILFTNAEEKATAGPPQPEQIVAVSAKVVRDNPNSYPYLRITNLTGLRLRLTQRYDHEALIDMTESSYERAKQPFILAAHDSMDVAHFQWVVATERGEPLGTLGAEVR